VERNIKLFTGIESEKVYVSWGWRGRRFCLLDTVLCKISCMNVIDIWMNLFATS